MSCGGEERRAERREREGEWEAVRLRTEMSGNSVCMCVLGILYEYVDPSLSLCLA